MSQHGKLLRAEEYKAAKTALLHEIQIRTAHLRAIRAPESPDAQSKMLAEIDKFNLDRGRELYFPYLGSGLGSGPYVELADGSVKLDLIAGIGIQFFGHSHPDLMAEIVDSLGSDLMIGNLQPSQDASRLLAFVLSKVKGKSRLRHGWLTTCGTMANELALKCIRQKRSPGTSVLAFEGCFAGRSTAMQEITDNPKYREGQPLFGQVEYVPFYEPDQSLRWNTDRTLSAMRVLLNRWPRRFCAFLVEIVQGEGGFVHAPAEFYRVLMAEARDARLAVWVDEIQTFGRTGELFAYQKLGLDDWVDLVTAAKMLQLGLVLMSEEYKPKPGLVAGTFAGGGPQLKAARKTLELLDEKGLLGENGRIVALSKRFVGKLAAHSKKYPEQVSTIRALGGMIAFKALDGSLDSTRAVLLKAFELGVVAFYCGHGPYYIRLLPPFGVMTDEETDEATRILLQAVVAVAADRKGEKEDSTP